jgi:tetratricopeptide (TPR) repeat protein
MMKQLLLVLFLVAQVALPLTGGAAMAEETKIPVSDKFAEIEKLLKEKNFEAALSAATKATQENPNSGQAFFLLGRTQFYREQDAAAQVALDKAIELIPSFADAWFFRGLIFVQTNQPDRARTDFEKATQLNPQEPKYWFELGKLNERAGKGEAATLALEKVVLLDPKRAAAWFALGTLASEKGDNAKAAEMWEKTLQIDPKYVDAHWNLGVHHQLRGDPKISLSHFLVVFEQRPQDLEAVKKLVQAYYRLEDFKNANSYRTRFLEVVAKSDDPKIRGMKEFCFDQFDASGGRFFAYESIEKKGDIFYWFTFKLVNNDGKIIKTINLETSSYLKERGLLFILGKNEGASHCTFNVAFKEMPPYSELKQLILKANNGQLEVAASSTPSAQ